MTYLLALSLLFNVLVVFLFLRHLREEQKSNRSDITTLDARHEQERIEWRKERQSLMDRIQHPEVLQPPEMPDEPPERTSLYYDDDEDLRKELERLGGQMEKAIEEHDGHS